MDQPHNPTDQPDKMVPLGEAHTHFANHKLTWSDDFISNTLNTSIWRSDEDNLGNTTGWGNSEKQWYTIDNASINNEMLIIEGRHENRGTKNYTSARLHTHGGRAFQYGVIEARIRMPSKNGITHKSIFPAFWMLGDNFSGWGHGAYGGDTGWPASGEIDITEVIGGPNGAKLNEVTGTLHWHVLDPDNECSPPFMSFAAQHCAGPIAGSEHHSDTLFTEFHIYSVRWTPNDITWYFDYEEYATIDIRDPRFDEFREPFFILLNFAIGSPIVGAPEPSAYPMQMAIDWVRHYCTTDAAGNCTTPVAEPPLPPPPDPTVTPTGTCSDEAIHRIYGDCALNGGSELADLTPEQASDGTLTRTDNTAGGARNTANSQTITRTGGNFGGVGWKKASGSLDLSSYSKLNFSYRLPDGASHSFFVKVETSGSACNEYTPPSLVADGGWHDVTIPTRTLFEGSGGGGCLESPTAESINVPFYIFLTGAGSVDIDEIYYD